MSHACTLITYMGSSITRTNKNAGDTTCTYYIQVQQIAEFLITIVNWYTLIFPVLLVPMEISNIHPQLVKKKSWRQHCHNCSQQNLIYSANILAKVSNNNNYCQMLQSLNISHLDNQQYLLYALNYYYT